MCKNMTVKYFLLVMLALFNSVEPIEVSLSYHSATAVVADNGIDDGIFTVVSGTELVVCLESVLSLRNSSAVISEINLDYQPDEVYAYSIVEEGIIHIVLTVRADEQSSRDEVAYCVYHYGRGQFYCYSGYRHPPTTSNFVASTRITDDRQVFVYAVYYDDHGNLIYYDVRGGHPQAGPETLPQNCRDNETTLIPVDEPKGRIILQCNNDSYLYDLYSGDLNVLPPASRKVATSKYRDLVLGTQPAAGLHQDVMVEVNVATDLAKSSARILEGSLANSTNPVRTLGVAVVVVNATSEVEVCFFLRSTGIAYFELTELETSPNIKHLSLPTGVTPIAIRGTYESTVVVEGINNGTSVLLVIKAYIPEPEDINNVTESNSITPSPPTHPTSLCTPRDHNTEPPTRPRPRLRTDKPQATGVANNPVNSPSTGDSSNNFGTGFGCGMMAGVLITLAIVAIVAILCRVTKSRGSIDVENARKNSDS